jgi:hypothetical protein
MDEVKKRRGRPKKIKTCPEGKVLYEPTNRCRKIKEVKEPKKRGRPANKDKVPKKTLPKIKNSSVVPPEPPIPLSILSPSVIPNPPAPPPSEIPPPILPLNNSSNYKKRIQKKSYIKPVKVIKQKEQIKKDLVSKEELVKKGKDTFNKLKKEKIKNDIPLSFTGLPSLDINQMSKLNIKPSNEFIKLQNKIKDSSSKKREMLDKMYMNDETKSANAIQKVFRGHQVRKEIVIV